MESSESIVSKFTETGEISYQQILNNLLDGDKNLDLKSHIFRPKELASLMTLSKHLTTLKYVKSSLLINNFIKYYLRYMVSFERESRREIIKALAPEIMREKQINTNLPTSLD